MDRVTPEGRDPLEFAQDEVAAGRIASNPNDETSERGKELAAEVVAEDILGMDPKDPSTKEFEQGLASDAESAGEVLAEGTFLGAISGVGGIDAGDQGDLGDEFEVEDDC